MPKKMCSARNVVKNENCFALEKRLETCPALLDGLGKKQRSRLFPSHKTFCLFLWQVLSAERSCSEAVQGFLAWRAHNQQAQASPNTAAYCRAGSAWI